MCVFIPIWMPGFIYLLCMYGLPTLRNKGTREDGAEEDDDCDYEVENSIQRFGWGSGEHQEEEKRAIKEENCGDEREDRDK